MKNKLKYTLAMWIVMTLSVIAVCFFTSLVAEVFGITLAPQPSLDAVLSSHGWKLAVNISLIVVAGPVYEEFIFRWLLFKLPSRWVNVKVMALFSAVLFSAGHYIQMPFPDNAFLALFVFGLFQCRLYSRTEVLWSPILTHSLFNSLNLVLLFLFPETAKMS